VDSCRNFNNTQIGTDFPSEVSLSLMHKTCEGDGVRNFNWQFKALGA
jgi:hypothetical protein